MSLTVTEASAVFDLLHWLGHHPVHRQEVTDERAAEALALLAEHAGARLQITVRADEVWTALGRLAGRLAGADSDGQAQEVCLAISRHMAHGGSLPWPSIRRPHEAWAAAHARAQEVPA